jgi:3',5'-cyclic-AMP phosphodiesterase
VSGFAVATLLPFASGVERMQASARTDRPRAVGGRSDQSWLARGKPEAPVATLNAPILAVLGNHDVPEYHRTAFGSVRVRKLGRWQVLGCASAVPGHDHGRIRTAELRSRLEGLRAWPTVLAMHHPPVPISRNPTFQLANAADLRHLLIGFPNVRAIVSAHVHSTFEIEQDGRQLLGGPSVRVPFEHDAEGPHHLSADEPAGARAIFLHDDATITSEVIEA